MDNVPPSEDAAGEDLEILARTVFGEASGELWDGKLAVAYVIVNRARLARAFLTAHGRPHPLFGDGTIRSACLVSHHGVHQFSCWNEGRDKDRMESAGAATPGWIICTVVAIAAAEGTGPNPIGNATHYFNPSAVAKNPAWSVGLSPCARIGHHLFFDHVS